MVSPAAEGIPGSVTLFCDHDHRSSCDLSRPKLSRSVRLNLGSFMVEFGVLTNRERAMIALIHSIVFLGIAIHGFAAPKYGVLRGLESVGDLILIGIYLIVASILLWLVSLSRRLRERAYFLLCAGSATSGLLRTIFGDPVIPPAQYFRVIFLTSAVAIGVLMMRSFSQAGASPEPAVMPSEASPE
jgi:hypothetical protein